jgi:hypothetical protein
MIKTLGRSWQGDEFTPICNGSERFRLAEIDSIFSRAAAIFAYKLGVPHQPLVFLQVFFHVPHILQETQVLLVLRVGHFKTGNLDDV